MNLNQLTYFVTLAQIENYTRAAKRLDITQPSLSHAISNLEKELQVPLFHPEQPAFPEAYGFFRSPYCCFF